jgi:hypothetical protein
MWLQTEPPAENTQLYKDKEGEEWATWEINREERGRVSGDERAGNRERVRASIGSLSGEKKPGIPTEH